MITTPTTCYDSPEYDAYINKNTPKLTALEIFDNNLTQTLNQNSLKQLFINTKDNLNRKKTRRSLFKDNHFKMTKEKSNLVVEIFSSDEDSILFENDICFEKDISLLEVVSKLHDPNTFVNIVK